MSPEQEPKYTVHGQTLRLMNRASGEEIPDDEPVFILRARDVRAHEAIGHYAGLCADEQHRETVWGRYNDFVNFYRQHPDRMKEPDSP